MKFCSNCGSSQITHTIPDGDNRLRYVCTACGTVHYQNPKIVVGCLVIHENKLMLCRRQIEPRAGKWNLPAGFMENNETVMDGAMREVREEANAEVEILQLHTVYSVLHAHQVYMLFLAKLKGDTFSAGDETSEVRFFALDEIPFDELAFNSNVFSIRRYLDNPSFTGIHWGKPEESGQLHR